MAESKGFEPLQLVRVVLISNQLHYHSANLPLDTPLRFELRLGGLQPPALPLYYGVISLAEEERFELSHPLKD